MNSEQKTNSNSGISDERIKELHEALRLDCIMDELIPVYIAMMVDTKTSKMVDDPELRQAAVTFASAKYDISREQAVELIEDIERAYAVCLLNAEQAA